MVHKFEDDDEEPLFLPPVSFVSFVVGEVQSEKDCLLVPEGKRIEIQSSCSVVINSSAQKGHIQAKVKYVVI